MDTCFSYSRDDGFTVMCCGTIDETPYLCITLCDGTAIYIQMNTVYLNKRQTLNTWRSWVKYLNKYSRYATRIVRIESLNRYN